MGRPSRLDDLPPEVIAIVASYLVKVDGCNTPRPEVLVTRDLASLHLSCRYLSAAILESVCSLRLSMAVLHRLGVFWSSELKLQRFTPLQELHLTAGGFWVDWLLDVLGQAPRLRKLAARPTHDSRPPAQRPIDGGEP